MVEKIFGQVRGFFVNRFFFLGNLGDYLKRVLQFLDSGSLVLSDEELRIYENKVIFFYFLVAQGSMEQVKLLLVYEVDVDCQTVCGYTFFFIVIQDQQFDFCILFLEYGVNVNLVDEDDWVLLYFVVQNGDDRIVRLFLDYGVYVDVQEYEGWILFYLVVQNNFENVVRFLVFR